MNKLLSCRYNMDTNRVEVRFEDGTTPAIDCIAVEDEYGNTRHSGQNLTGCCTISRWSMPRWCWVGRLSTTCHLAVTMEEWKID